MEGCLGLFTLSPLPFIPGSHLSPTPNTHTLCSSLPNTHTHEGNNGIEESTELDFEAAAALPKHAAAIRKRMNTLRSTIRSKHQKKENGTGPAHSSHSHAHSHSRGDVRNIFNSVGGPQSQEPATHVSSQLAAVDNSNRLVSY